MRGPVYTPSASEAEAWLEVTGLEVISGAYSFKGIARFHCANALSDRRRMDVRTVAIEVLMIAKTVQTSNSSLTAETFAFPVLSLCGGDFIRVV